MSTMSAAGLASQLGDLRVVLGRWPLLSLTLLANVVVVPITTANNAGPALAAVGVGFRNDAAIVAAVSGILLVELAVAPSLFGFLGHRRHPPEESRPADTGMSAAES